MVQNNGILTNSNSTTSCPDSNLRPQCEASGTLKNLPRLEPRDEDRKSEIHRLDWRNRGIEVVTVAHFGAYVNDVLNFSIKLGGKKRA
ncbi:hypothetical protein AVEN_163732-1 [Araneus ventricosus]|uniref:Uncharacterized protein n=1 Tax=Araneus ventricosus TaxID=182803 RepID=A0A4Y2TP37_ARAVE|nr:hypothetical protein AVEN_163732-1 [Araneus ventricosus]